MAYLTDDKQTLILDCVKCGGEVRYATDYPFANRTREDYLKSVMTAWRDKSEICDACLFGPTKGVTDDVHRQSGTVDGPKGPSICPPVESPQVEVTYTPPHRDHAPPVLYDVRKLQSILGISRGRVLKFIREEIIPINGCVRMGNRYQVHVWALNQALSARTVRPRPKRVYSSRRLQGLKSQTLQKSRPTSPEMLPSSSGEKS